MKNDKKLINPNTLSTSTLTQKKMQKKSVSILSFRITQQATFFTKKNKLT